MRMGGEVWRRTKDVGTRAFCPLTSLEQSSGAQKLGELFQVSGGTPKDCGADVYRILSRRGLEMVTGSTKPMCLIEGLTEKVRKAKEKWKDKMRKWKKGGVSRRHYSVELLGSTSKLRHGRSRMKATQ